MDYGDAKCLVVAMLRKHKDRRLKGTIVKYNLAVEIGGMHFQQPRRPSIQSEREASIHVRKMVAEGEIEESMIDKRLYYILPTQETV